MSLRQSAGIALSALLLAGIAVDTLVRISANRRSARLLGAAGTYLDIDSQPRERGHDCWVGIFRKINRS
jgi:homoserine acetyltransferase